MPTPRRAALLADHSKGSLPGPYNIILSYGDSYTDGKPERHWGSQARCTNGVGQIRCYGSDPFFGWLDANTVPLNEEQGPVLGRRTFAMAEAFAAALQRSTGITHIILPMGHDGTRLVGTGNYWSVGSTGHEEAVTNANNAISLLQQNYPGSKFVGIVQWLGANDMSGAVTRSAFSTALNSAISDFRSRITGATNCWFAMGGILPDYICTTYAQNFPIEFALQDVHRAGTNVIYVPMVTGFNSGDNLHATAIGSAWMGNQLVTALNDPTTPNITVPTTFAIYEGTNLRIELTADRYASWSLSGTDAASFQIVEETYGAYWGNANINSASYKIILQYTGNAVMPTYATKSSYSVTLTAKGSNGLTSSQALTINVKQAYGTAGTSTGSPTVTFVSNQDLAINSFKAQQIPAMAFGAGLNLVYVFQNGNVPAAFTSLSVNNVAGTLVKAAATGTCSQVWAVQIAQAGNYPISIVGGGTNTSRISVACLTNTAATAASVDSLDYASRAAPFTGASLTCPTGGVIVGVGEAVITSAGSGCTVLQHASDGTFLVTRTTTGSIILNGSNGFSGIISMAFAAGT